MTEMRRITVDLPAHLVDIAIGSSGRDLADVLEQALREHNHRAASQALLGLRGKVQFESTWQELRGKDDED